MIILVIHKQHSTWDWTQATISLWLFLFYYYFSIMKKYLPTSFIGTVQDYPYGYTLKTTATFGVEFKKWKWFRTVFQTVNPKTGKLNKPKVSTYSDIIFMYENEDGHYKYHHFDLNTSMEKLNKIMNLVVENKSILTDEQLKHIADMTLVICKTSIHAMVVYCGANLEDLKPLYTDFVNAISKLDFETVRLDHVAIEATKVEWYKPFNSR